MAKLTAPLFSFSARGQLAKTLVYSGWKGIDDVRSYAIPANPKSAAQQSQRGAFSNAVATWHNPGLSQDDVTAFNRLASTQSRPMSGFNVAIKEIIEDFLGGIAFPQIIRNGIPVDLGAGAFDFSADVDTSNGIDGGDLAWGYSPTSLLNHIVPVVAANVFNIAPGAAVPGTTIYLRPTATDGGLAAAPGGIYKLLLA